MLCAPPMGGEGFSVQIDESLFRWKRKYNVGRHLAGDQKHKETFIDEIQKLIDVNKSKRNYGKRVDGPWVFGLVLQKKSDLEEIAEVKKLNLENKKIKNKKMQIQNQKA